VNATLPLIVEGAVQAAGIEVEEHGARPRSAGFDKVALHRPDARPGCCGCWGGFDAHDLGCASLTQMARMITDEVGRISTRMGANLREFSRMGVNSERGEAEEFNTDGHGFPQMATDEGGEMERE
jgi:hypothetical protein